jgi:hypothetical protein
MCEAGKCLERHQCLDTRINPRPDGSGKRLEQASPAFARENQRPWKLGFLAAGAAWMEKPWR